MAGVTSTIPITIGTTLIQFPNTGASPIWSEAVIQFAQAVELAIASASSPFDIAPTVQILTSNVNTNLPLNGNGADLTFPTSFVRSFNFNYSIYRVSDSVNIVDEGTVIGIFNSTSSRWSINHSFQGNVQSNGIPWNTFNIVGNNLVLSTRGIPGVYDTINSTISYSATTELVAT